MDRETPPKATKTLFIRNFPARLLDLFHAKARLLGKKSGKDYLIEIMRKTVEEK